MKSKSAKLTLFIAATLAVVVSLTALYFTIEDEKEQLSLKSIQLEQELYTRDSAYNEIIDIMYSLESQVGQIKDRENLVNKISSGDLTKSNKRQLVEDMDLIDSLIIETNGKVSRLMSKLETANVNMNTFKSRIAELSDELKERKASVDGLREDLASKNVMIADLSTDLKMLEYKSVVQEEKINVQVAKIDEQEKKLNEAYYAIGTKKALEEEGLIVKEGGVLWFGKTSALEKDVPKEKFSEIDIRTTQNLLVDSEEVDLVTEHPSDSYEIVKEGDKAKFLKITNPDEFWRISKYLVVAVND
ncbi:hypothetical protein N7E81_18090 [Reichenbachiella carrageenanivorans]|uniref:Chromosome partition protein Smc n=1 Tax=Reichenbachiella carrageenanivorans TaxID=2979869 RepID=A0ABY6CZC8_9BACT|nr:hypothetical protein [Reichenbachiella carrageenanivorans]UXX79266.1 hypothetical protein N7E81_18090 [Reichenbachiella carrageenanivorans]